MEKIQCSRCGQEIQLLSNDDKRNKLFFWIITGISSISAVAIVTILVLTILRTPTQADAAYRDPNNFVNLEFKCIDNASGAVITNCAIHMTIIDESRITEFELNTSERFSGLIRMKRRVSITADSSGYSQASQIFEYTDDGTVTFHEISLEKAVP